MRQEAVPQNTAQAQLPMYIRRRMMTGSRVLTSLGYIYRELAELHFLVLRRGKSLSV